MLMKDGKLWVGIDVALIVVCCCRQPSRPPQHTSPSWCASLPPIE
jgi:hypothetical protein